MLLECSDDWFFFLNTRMHWTELVRTCTRLFNRRMRTGKFSNCTKQVQVKVQPPLNEDGEEDDGVQLSKDGEKTWIYGWAKRQQYCRRWFSRAVQFFTSWTSADVHIVLLGVTWLKPWRTQGNHFHSVCTGQLRVQLGRKDMSQLERSVGMPRGLKTWPKRHMFIRRMLKGKHDEGLQTCKRTSHWQVEKAGFPALGRDVRHKFLPLG